MVVGPKRDLHTLIDHLSNDDAAETLAFARRLRDVHEEQTRSPASGPPSRHAVPTLHRAPAIASIDDLKAALFGAEESAVEFDRAIRRWREEPEGD